MRLTRLWWTKNFRAIAVMITKPYSCPLSVLAVGKKHGFDHEKYSSYLGKKPILTTCDICETIAIPNRNRMKNKSCNNYL